MTDFENMLNQITNQKVIDTKINIWTESLQYEMMNFSYRITTFTLGSPLAASSSLLVMQHEPLKSNAMRKYREVETILSKRRNTTLEGSNEVLQPRRPSIIKHQKHKAKSRSYELFKLAPDGQSFTAIDVAKILASCKSPRLDFWCYIGQINGWKHENFFLHNLRVEFNDIINSVRLKLKVSNYLPETLQPFLLQLAREYDRLQNMKSGFLLLCISKLMNEIRTVTRAFVTVHAITQPMIMSGIAALSVTDSIYTSFMISQKIFQEYKAVKKLIPEDDVENFEQLEDLMWEFLEYLDRGLMLKSKNLLYGSPTDEEEDDSSYSYSYYSDDEGGKSEEIKSVEKKEPEPEKRRWSQVLP